MTFDTYWLVAPLVLIGLSGLGWLTLWITRDRGARDLTPVQPLSPARTRIFRPLRSRLP